MLPNDDQVKMLRAALQVSPDNLPLRQHMAQLLMGMGDAIAAEPEYISAIALTSPQTPEHTNLTLGLARCYTQQSKNQQALGTIEALLKTNPTHTEALTLHAQLLLRTGNTQQATAQFRQALQQDESLKESALAKQLAEQIAAPVSIGTHAAANDTDTLDANSLIEHPTITFDNVGGMDALKEEIRLKIIYPLTHADLYQAYGQSIGGGILLYGPPGCGKTHLARATAGEIRAGFIPVSIDDILDMWLGNSEKNLHDIFDQARRNAPCVLFFDEADALASKRSDMRQNAGSRVINQFLTELDGVKYANEGVLILAATNAPWYIDSAFRRPGRFDRVLFVQPPDAAARSAILRLLCKGKPVDNIDFELIAKQTNQFSGADLKAVVDRAVETKLQEAMKTGLPKPLTTKDLRQSSKAISPSTKEWFGTARNYATHANQNGTYDDILTYLKQR
ncbi:MAG: AAA family ATPase [Cyanobacteria bacterium J06598_3]